MVVLVEAVHGGSAKYRDTERRDLGELDGVVLPTVDRLTQVVADLGRIHVEGRDELEVADVVTTQDNVHESGDIVALLCVLVIGDALNE